MQIFLDAVDYRQFEFLLGMVVDEYGIECWGFVGMSNHYHAILRPTRANISRAMQRLNGEYAKWWNNRHGRVGHTFQGRFKDQIVSRGDYLMTLIRYVARNPLRAGMVNDLSEWRYGSFRALAGLEGAPAFLSVETVLSQFGVADTAILQARFKAFVVANRDDGAIEDRIRSKDRILGDSAFKKEILKELALPGSPRAGETPAGGDLGSVEPSPTAAQA